jgi:hypothetical protein
MGAGLRCCGEATSFSASNRPASRRSRKSPGLADNSFTSCLPGGGRRTRLCHARRFAALTRSMRANRCERACRKRHSPRDHAAWDPQSPCQGSRNILHRGLRAFSSRNLHFFSTKNAVWHPARCDRSNLQVLRIYSPATHLTLAFVNDLFVIEFGDRQNDPEIDCHHGNLERALSVTTGRKHRLRRRNPPRRSPVGGGR